MPLLVVKLPPQLSAYKHPGFTVRLILADKTIEFQPEFADFEVAILDVYNKMLSSVSLIPRVETKLFSETVRNTLLSSPLTLALKCKTQHQIRKHNIKSENTTSNH